ncbi:hypothetical protein FGO68_gene6999 [Halteria grandinella]|uniref:Uncharacterized protein n=1 Tax=Halteria grandinella TaxID=5974 RepID=A0A8J8P6I0_HALGN|nr:hypothetical protein FGO68_gene6999 [Halteria grandinella]
MYKANKLVSSDNQHVLLERNERFEFEIIEGTSLLLKVEIQSRVPPLKLYFDYLETTSKKGDLTVCLSRRVKQPQLLTSEKVYHRPKLISLDTADPFYLQQYLYIGLYSEQGCQFGVKATFPKDEQGGGQVRTRGAVGESVSNAYGTKGATDVAADEIRRRPGGVNRQMMRFKLEIDRKVRELSEDTKLIENFDFELEELKKKHFERQLALSIKNGLRDEDKEITDHVRKNKSVAAEWYHAQRDGLKSRQETSQERTTQALQRKEAMQQEELKRKTFLLHKWSLMKVKRQQFHEFYKSMFEQRAKAKEWIKLMILSRHISSFRDSFIEQRRLYEYEAFKERQVRRIDAQYRRALSKQGPTMRQRQKRMIRNILSLVGFMKYDNAISQSIETIKEFMHERAYYFVLREKFISTRNKIFHVYNTMKNYSTLERARIRFLQEVWHYTVDIMMTEKKHKKKLDKLKMLPDSVRDDFLSEYYKRAKIMHRLKVYIQMNETQGTPLSEKDPQRMEMKKQIKLLEKKLGFKKAEATSKRGAEKAQAAPTKGLQQQKTKPLAPNKDLIIIKADAKASQPHLQKLTSPQNFTTDIAKTIHQGAKRDVFRYYPNRQIMRGMIEKALEAYDKLLIKRRETVSMEAKRQAMRSAGENQAQLVEGPPIELVANIEVDNVE